MTSSLSESNLYVAEDMNEPEELEKNKVYRQRTTSEFLVKILSSRTIRKTEHTLQTACLFCKKMGEAK